MTPTSACIDPAASQLFTSIVIIITFTNYCNLWNLYCNSKMGVFSHQTGADHELIHVSISVELIHAYLVVYITNNAAKKHYRTGKAGPMHSCLIVCQPCMYNSKYKQRSFLKSCESCSSSSCRPSCLFYWDEEQ
jgi:hypothetical protein